MSHRLSCIHKGEIMNIIRLLHKTMNIWDKWGIYILALVSFALQILLTFNGSRRKYIRGFGIRFTVWVAYTLSSSVAKLILGNVTDIDKSSPMNELQALLAPFLLLQLGYPDTITAYSIEDNKLGLRQILTLIFQIGVTIYILVNQWTSKKLSFLFVPMFLAGIIKYGEATWAVKSALRSDRQISKEIKQEVVANLPRGIPNLELILKAYYRFDCLKPHLENWLYRPNYESLQWLSIDAYSPEDAFNIIDAELGFMYDVLYTKAPVIYTRIGCTLRIISFVCLASTLCAIIVLYKEICLNHRIAYCTFAVLIATIMLEVYQITRLLFSDWAIIQMIRHHNNSFMVQCLQFLGPKSCQWKRWSNSLGQFNLLNFCLHDKPLKLNRFIKLHGIDMEFRKSRYRKHVTLPKELKALIVEEVKEVDQVTDSKLINQRGQRALGRYGCLHQLEWSAKQDFEKSIIVWHVATNICYNSDVQHDTMNSQIEMSKLLSNYLMYLLAVRPHMLCSNTAEVIFYHSYIELVKFLRTRTSIVRDEDMACTALITGEFESRSNSGRDKKNIITSNWNVLQDAQRLAKDLMSRGSRWYIMSSVWVEMLCYAASNCSIENHAEQLRRGGSLITHVWRLLAHKTRKFSIDEE